MALLLTKGTQLEEVAPQRARGNLFLGSLALVFVIAMHYFQQNPGGAGLHLSFNATTWMAFSITVAVGLYGIVKRHVLRYSSLTITLFIACFILTLPILYAESNLQDSMLRLIGLWAGWLFLVLLQQYHFTIKQKHTLLWIVLVAILIEAAFGYVQYMYLQPGNMFGYNTETNRPYGIFQQPNVMASFLATGLVIAGYLLARQKQISENYHPIATGILYLVPIITIPLLWVLASRTGWLGAGIASLLLLPYLKSFLPKKALYLWLIALTLGLVGGYTLATASGGNDLVTKKSNLESPRRYTFPQTLDMVIEKPLTGYGYGKFEPAYMVYTARQHQLNSDYHPGLPSMDHPHNEVLYWAVEGGIVPLLGLLLAALVVLRRVLKAQTGSRLALVALFFPILLHTQLEYPFYHSAAHWLIFIILIYWVDQLTGNYQNYTFSTMSKSIMSVSSLIIPIVTCFYMIAALHTNYLLTRFEYQKPMNPELLNQVSNPSVWQDRFDWDVYKTQLEIGLKTHNLENIQPYIDWAPSIIERQPRSAYYTYLILAYQGMGETRKAEVTRAEASFLFPNKDFSKLNYNPPSASESSVNGSEKQLNEPEK